MSAPSSTPQALALADLMSELLSIFECPVCLDTVMPPILLCMNGHLLCSTCGKDIAACPLCRANISNVRALAMEKVVERLPYPCKYSEYGCPTQPLLIAKPDHEKTCAFRVYPCAFEAEYSCKWTGLPTKMIDHIRSDHPEERIQCGEKAKQHIFKDRNTAQRNEQRTLQSSFGQLFLIVLSKEGSGNQYLYGKNLYYLLVQFVRLPEEANKFSLQLEIRGNNQALTWTCTPSSVLESVSAIIERTDCLVFDAWNFIRGQNLSVDVTVQRHTVQ